MNHAYCKLTFDPESYTLFMKHMQSFYSVGDNNFDNENSLWVIATSITNFKNNFWMNSIVE